MNYKLRIKKSKKAGRKTLSEAKGYTLIETMISISIFSIIVVAGMGALLNANLLFNKAKGMRSIMDSMSFAMDDISRNLRTGITYDCVPPLGAIPGTLTATSGQTCGGIAFKPANDTMWVYYIAANPTNSSYYSIFKIVDGGTAVQLTPDEVHINTAASYFSVLGAEAPSSGDTQQPFVTIHLTGTILYKNVVTPFSLQTSVSQRQVDI